MYILGINAYHADASAAIVCDGKLVAAAEEERFNRIKHCAGFPYQAVKYCLDAAGIKPEDLTHIAVARDTRANLDKKLLYALKIPQMAMRRLAPQGKFAGIKEDVAKALDVDPATLTADIARVEHHKAHLASAFYVSGFEDAALLSVDGLGDFASTMWGIGRGTHMKIDGSIAFPHSLGFFYTALTQYLGFWRYGDEFKVMGLASYGQPEYREEFAKIVLLEGQNGKPKFNLGLDYFIHHKIGSDITWDEGIPVIGKLFSDHLEKRLGTTREANSEVTQRHFNIAASLQARLEDSVMALLNKLYELHGIKRVCLAGGVAYNCVANGKIFDRTPFEQVYVQAAAGDAGLAIGSAFYVQHQVLGRPRDFVMEHAYWGPEFSNREIRVALDKIADCGVRIAEFCDTDIARETAARIADGKIVGWYQGRLEFGPRALGNRSIVVDPRRAEMKDILNSRVKHRESFRPFAPSILENRVGEYFEHSHPSPFMLMAYSVKPEKRSAIPAPTHVDGTGRLQSVNRDQNPRYWQLITEFDRLTGVPVVLNTSFNDNEPVVCRPEEAIDCFQRTKMDVLAIGNYLVEKI
ncbi:MAG: carbamoyltransferase [Acidobacteria bacterium]|nr:carbamoyltransferase [Acidobacteriota bacterium]